MANVTRSKIQGDGTILNAEYSYDLNLHFSV